MIIKTINGKKRLENCEDLLYSRKIAVISGGSEYGENNVAFWYKAVLRGDVHFIKMGDKVECCRIGLPSSMLP